LSDINLVNCRKELMGQKRFSVYCSSTVDRKTQIRTTIILYEIFYLLFIYLSYVPSLMHYRKNNLSGANCERKYCPKTVYCSCRNKIIKWLILLFYFKLYFKSNACHQCNWNNWSFFIFLKSLIILDPYLHIYYNNLTWKKYICPRWHVGAWITL